MVYAAVGYHGKTPLRFVQPGTRVNSQSYQEMCRSMFEDIRRLRGDSPWVWCQDGAKPHTARATLAFFAEQNVDFIRPEHWPSKSPDLNPLDYSIWSILGQALSRQRALVHSLDDLKEALREALDDIPMQTIQAACSGWTQRLRLCADQEGADFEHLL